MSPLNLGFTKPFGESEGYWRCWQCTVWGIYWEGYSIILGGPKKLQQQLPRSGELVIAAVSCSCTVNGECPRPVSITSQIWAKMPKSLWSAWRPKRSVLRAPQIPQLIANTHVWYVYTYYYLYIYRIKSNYYYCSWILGDNAAPFWNECKVAQEWGTNGPKSRSVLNHRNDPASTPWLQSGLCRHRHA